MFAEVCSVGCVFFAIGIWIYYRHLIKQYEMEMEKEEIQ